MYIWFPDKIPGPLPVGIKRQREVPVTRSLSLASRQNRARPEFYPVSAYHSKSFLIQRFGQASDATTATIEYMGVDHRCFHVLVPKLVLNRADVIAILPADWGYGTPIGSRTPSHSLPLDPSSRVGASSSAPNSTTKLSTTN